MARYIAIDLGGGSGRVIVGKQLNGVVEIEEISRFTNQQIERNGSLCWDSKLIFDNIMAGLTKAAQQYDDIVSIGIDSWGVDFVLIDEKGELVGDTVCYRDRRTDGIDTELFTIIDREKHYARTGIQQMSINTLMQLYALKREHPEQLHSAHRLLFTPDYYAYKLCGIMANEYTIASTSELLDAKTKGWDRELIATLGFPDKLFGTIVKPGTTLAPISEAIATITGLPRYVNVVAVASHDTASAVASLGHIGSNALFLSSGTWSLLGMTLTEPVLTSDARLAGLTNEGGYNGTIRLLQNITGLWMMQSLMRQWERKDYTTLLHEAERSTMTTVVDVDDPSLVSPNNMEEAIAQLCGDKKPKSNGDFVKVALLSLAHRYKKGVAQLEAISGQNIENIYIIGGGSKNGLLNRLTADVTGKKVIVGDSEATAIGNIVVQINAHK